MTPEAWFAATDPQPPLAFVHPSPPLRYGDPPPPLPKALARRLTLFGCACARMVWDILPTNVCNAIEIRERFAEGRASEADLRAAEVRTTWTAITVKQHATNAAGADPAFAARAAAYAPATRAAGHAPPGHPTNRAWHALWNRTYHAARTLQAAFVRDIFPPPDYAPHLDPAWLTSTVTALARQMDESGDFSATPILADALQDAGCEDETVLQCCRVPGNVHVR